MQSGMFAPSVNVFVASRERVKSVMKMHVFLVKFYRRVDHTEDEGRIIRRRGYRIYDRQQGLGNLVDINLKHADKNIALILKISVNNTCRNSRSFRDFNGIRAVITFLGKKLVASLNDLILFFY